MKPLTHIVLIAILISGCQSNPKRVPDLHYGMTHEEVDDAIWGDDLHEFSALIDENVLKCYKVEFGYRAGARYYFLFENDRLTSIVESAQFFDWMVVEKSGQKISRQAPWDAEERLHRILAAEPLTVKAFQDDATSRLEEAAKSGRGSQNIPMFVWVAFSPLLVPYGLQENRKTNKWERAFTAESIETGMTAQQVDDIYGPPVFVLFEEERETRAYGPVESLWRKEGRVSLYPGERYWTAVVFENGKAVRVFSDNLFDIDDLVQDELMVEN